VSTIASIESTGRILMDERIASGECYCAWNVFELRSDYYIATHYEKIGLEVT
jgi:hypothetical protein